MLSVQIFLLCTCLVIIAVCVGYFFLSITGGNISKGMVVAVALFLAAVVTVIPLALNLIFSTDLHFFVESDMEKEVWLGYWASYLGFVGSLVLSIVALWQNQRLAKVNDKLNDKNKLLLDALLNDNLRFTDASIKIMDMMDSEDEYISLNSSIFETEDSHQNKGKKKSICVVLNADNKSVALPMAFKIHAVNWKIKSSSKDSREYVLKCADANKNVVRFKHVGDQSGISLVIRYMQGSRFEYDIMQHFFYFSQRKSKYEISELSFSAELLYEDETLRTDQCYRDIKISLKPSLEYDGLREQFHVTNYQIHRSGGYEI